MFMIYEKHFFLSHIAIVIFISSTVFFNPNIQSYGEENKNISDSERNFNLYLLSKVFEKEIEKISNIVEMVDNSPEFQILSYNNVSKEYMTLYHGIPENEELEKRSIFKSVMEISPSISGLFFLLPNGDMYVEEPYYYQQNLTKTNFSFRDYYYGAINSGEMYMGDVIISAASGIPISVVAIPIYTQSLGNVPSTSEINNTMIGILGVDVNFKTFDNFLKSLPLSTNKERMVFLDGFGNKIADSSKSNFKNESSIFSGLSSFKSAINGLSGNTIEEFDNKTKIQISYAPVKSIQKTWALLWLKPYTENQVQNQVQN